MVRGPLFRGCPLNTACPHGLSTSFLGWGRPWHVSFPHCCLFLMFSSSLSFRQYLAIYPRLALTLQSSCLHFLSSRITDISYTAWLICWHFGLCVIWSPSCVVLCGCSCLSLCRLPATGKNLEVKNPAGRHPCWRSHPNWGAYCSLTLGKPVKLPRCLFLVCKW